MVEAARAVGAENCVLSTGIGQAYNPESAQGMRMMISCMLKYRLTEKEIEPMVKTNLVKLFGIN
jgi:hypothetical protein